MDALKNVEVRAKKVLNPLVLDLLGRAGALVGVAVCVWAIIGLASWMIYGLKGIPQAVFQEWICVVFIVCVSLFMGRFLRIIRRPLKRAKPEDATT